MQTPPEEYNVVVLGSGEAGKYLAWTLGKKGMRAVVIERKYVGGSCPNIACLPSKNIIHSAKVASYFWRSGEFGITKDNTRINMSGVRDRKRKMVDGLVDMHLANFKASGAELLKGLGASSDPKRLRSHWLTAAHASFTEKRLFSTRVLARRLNPFRGARFEKRGISPS
jgi:pyruvate/2-oxoglutarate dehydrogenase complex dihydrolipoamide dehydrogenase (E3) component